MHFGIFILLQQRNKHKTSHQSLRDAVDQTRQGMNRGSARHGLRGTNQFSNHGMRTPPPTMIAHCAAAARRIRLGTGIVVASLCTPSRASDCRRSNGGLAVRRPSQ